VIVLDTTALYVTAITLAEIFYGLKILADGQRKESLQKCFIQYVEQGFEFRMLEFDKISAMIYAEIMDNRRRMGKQMSLFDGQIASITRTQRFELATRNTKDFDYCEINPINPFINH
jgi:hypothetical protein